MGVQHCWEYGRDNNARLNFTFSCTSPDAPAVPPRVDLVVSKLFYHTTQMLDSHEIPRIQTDQTAKEANMED